MAVRLWPTLPKDHESNGLTALERPLIDEPDGPYYFVAEVNRRRATIDDDSEETVPTIRVLHGEALFGELARTARQLLDQAQEKRVGPKPRPAPPAPTLFGPDETGEGDLTGDGLDPDDDTAPAPGSEPDGDGDGDGGYAPVSFLTGADG